MRPGRQLFTVLVPDVNREQQTVELSYFTHKIVVPKRIDEIPHFAKAAKTKINVRTFDKANSVFCDWIEDEKGVTSEQAVDKDLLLWHCDKFVKDPEELEDLCNVVRKYAEPLKNIFIQVASRSAFPQIGWQDFTVFSNKTQIPD